MISDQGRFVVLKHTRAGRGTHWDIMFESEKVLTTFRLEKAPDNLRRRNEAVKIADHEMRFLAYEGPVNKGQGKVERVEKGSYRVTKRSGNKWSLDLSGDVLQGDYLLEKLQADQWIFERSG